MRFFNNNIIAIAIFALLAVTTTSCFKEEPLNAECDIEKAWLHVDDVDAMFYSATDTLINVISTEDKIISRMASGAASTPCSATGYHTMW